MTAPTVPAAYRAPMVAPRALAEGVVGVRAVADPRADARLERFCAVPDGSFVWTLLGGHHLGRVSGPCRQDDSPAALTDELVHVRDCDWLPGPVDPVLVPEQVVHAFARGGRNFQRINLPGAAAATARAWDQLG